jgi:starch phosphorylase
MLGHPMKTSALRYPTRSLGVSKPQAEEIRTGLSPKAIAAAFRDNLAYIQARFPEVATLNDKYMALAYAVRDRLLDQWITTARTYYQERSRSVCYLSAEFLLGPQLANNLINIGIYDAAAAAMKSLGLDLEALLEQEEEPGLGNGGLGRLAACYLDSLATQGIPALGYGIRYEFGIFDQAFQDGWQVELTDKWLRLGNPWEICRPEITFDIKFGGRTEAGIVDGKYAVRWVPDQVVRGMAYDTPVAGYRNKTVNLLRLWKAEAVESFDFQAFNTGDYYRSVLAKIVSENITKVLYPNDESQQGKELRLKQQYFFVSCALQDMIRMYGQRSRDIRGLDSKFVVQLNDTHPAIGVAELMRLLIDDHGLGWEPSWEITQRVFGYTNHTLMPEALERWSVPLFGALLPRHLELIYEINRRFLDEVRLRYPDDEARLARLSLIDESGPRYVRMAHLACVGSHMVNGVAKLHSNLLKTGVLKDFYEFWPAKFTNVTNGVTPRRFMLLSNPGLASLITQRIGDAWPSNLEELRKLEQWADDPEFQTQWHEVKQRNKRALADFLLQRTAIQVEPSTLFDIHVKRLHEYKRQHLNVLHVITLYNRLLRNPDKFKPARTFVFGGKAAPGYYMAKLIIKLINSVAEVVNNDPRIKGRIKVAYLPDFNVQNAQKIYPAADLSEQISTAGMEASGTGNMKFAMNGALTIGTLDGANIEIRDEVGHENFFVFGLTTEQVAAQRAQGYRPRDFYESDPELRLALDSIAGGVFSETNPELFKPLVAALLDVDHFMALADYRSYIDCQELVGKTYLNKAEWARKSIMNVARMGYFSSDRAIREYAKNIWHTAPVALQSDGNTPLK